MAIATKPSKSNVTWPTPSAGRVSSDSINGPDRFFGRHPYRHANRIDPVLANRPRVIIPNNGVSLGQTIPR